MQEIPDTRTSALNTRSLPLAGKRVLITRTREQASALHERLRSAGASCVEFPTIQVVPPQDWGELDAALRRLYASQEKGYDWLILTSTNGVKIFFQRLAQLGYRSEDLQAKQHVRMAAVGPATVAALERYHVPADLVPEEYVGEGVVTALLQDAEQRGTSLIGQRILLARAADARKALVADLQQAGALVDEVVAYYKCPVASNDAQGQEVLRLLRNHQLDIVTFTSSSTVRNFVAWLCREGAGPIGANLSDRVAGIGGEEGDEGEASSPLHDGTVPIDMPSCRGELASPVCSTRTEAPKFAPMGAGPLSSVGTADTGVTPTVSDSPLSLLRETRIASIGPITSQTVRELGLHVDIEAKEFTIDGLVDAIVKHDY